MSREAHVRFWESAALGCAALLAYLKGYADGREARAGIAAWISFYNLGRPHQALANRTPMAVWREGVIGALEDTAVDMTLRLDNAGALSTCPPPPQQQAILVA
jgi:putative transposase